MKAARARPRTAARVAAVQALFQAEQAETPAEVVIEEFLSHRLGSHPDNGSGDGGFENGQAPDADVPLFKTVVRTATAQQAALDALVVAALDPEWTFQRLDPVLRALLRAGAAELWMRNGPPARVVINEYLDVAHGFFDGEVPRMANGLLDRIARQLRPDEFPGPGEFSGPDEFPGPDRPDPAPG